MKLPRYVKQTGKTLRYQKDYPSHLYRLYNKKTFTTPLGLQAGCSEGDLQRALARANDLYDLHCRQLETSDPSAFDASDIDKLATELLRKRGVKPGQFARVADPEISKEEEANQEQRQPHPYDYADEIFPEINNLLLKDDAAMTVEEKALEHAWKTVQAVASRKPRTLQTLWDEYRDERSIDISTREGKRIQGCWDRFIAITGDTFVAEHTLDHIHAGLDAYAAEKLEEGQVSSSIRRNLAEPLAALKRGSRKYRLGWVIEPPSLPRQPRKTKPVLDHEQQRSLVKACRDWDDGISACILIMLQAGAMPSEIQRIDPEKDLHLNAAIPHIILRGGDAGRTKTHSRKRVVPIVLGEELIADHIEEAIDWLRKVTDSTPSATIKKRLKAALDVDGFTGHCLRHTLRANCTAVSANLLAVASIAGWKVPGGGVSDIMLEYGAEGLSSSEVLKNLRNESLKIHRHLLVDLDAASNVTPLTSASAHK
ncbi:site-specific integrase [Luminiphilus syltensis]|nr:hypothetical protein [Luminiphilus syltensis]